MDAKPLVSIILGDSGEGGGGGGGVQRNGMMMPNVHRDQIFYSSS